MGFNSAPGSGLGNGPVKTQEKVLTPEDRSAKREDIDRRIEAKKEELKKLSQQLYELRSDTSINLEKAKVRGSVEQERLTARTESKNATQQLIDNLKADIEKLKEQKYS